MAADGVLSWRPLSFLDLPLLGRWLDEPQVRRWWNHDASPEAVERDFGASCRGEEAGQDLVVLLDDRPVGLLQRSFVHDYPEDLEEYSRLLDVPKGTVQLDYLLGDAADRGRGLGARLIRAAVEDTWRTLPAATHVMVAVVAANTASWKAVERAGLPRVAEGAIPPDNPLHHVYLVKRPGD